MTTGTTTEGLPIAEAADRLGISLSAARKRVTRGRLDAYKGDDGLWYVHLPDDLPEPATGHSDGLPMVIETLKDEVQFLRAELEKRNQELERRSDELRSERDSRAEADRRRDVLLAQFNDHLGQLSTTTSTVIKQIEAVAHEVIPVQDTGSPTDTPVAVPVSWWRRVFLGQTG